MAIRTYCLVAASPNKCVLLTKNDAMLLYQLPEDEAAATGYAAGANF